MELDWSEPNLIDPHLSILCDAYWFCDMVSVSYYSPPTESRVIMVTDTLAWDTQIMEILVSGIAKPTECNGHSLLTTEYLKWLDEQIMG